MKENKLNQRIFQKGMVISSDGTPIGYRYAGSGPGLIILHGGLRSSIHYEQLGSILADHYSVYIPDRRGRGDSGPVGEDYSLEKELDDLSALMQKTGARIIFGHCTGGLIALEAAMQLPIETLMVYEPAISINHSLPMTWLGKYEKAINKQNYAQAMALFMKALSDHWMAKLPLWMLRIFTSVMLSGDNRDEIIDLLKSVVWEAKLSLTLDSTHGKYTGVQADTLLLYGSESPLYLLKAMPLLAEKIPSIRVKMLPGQNHAAADENAAHIVADQMLQFLKLNTKIEQIEPAILQVPDAAQLELVINHYLSMEN